jgi:hypothetical protein
MNKPNKKELKVIWEEVEDPDFEEYLQRISEIITHNVVGPEKRKHVDDGLRTPATECTLNL